MAKKAPKVAAMQRMFRDPSGQEHMFDKSLQEQLKAEANRPVECLGMTFPNDEARRKHFVDKLREKLKDPEFRKIEGFPVGKDKDIIALSDPPYYTACPNPFVSDFIKHYGTPFNPKIPYSREPFAADVSEGKSDPIYNAHSYHTKVPPKAIMRYILHYTDPGNIVYDGFAGTGMTGVAAQLCGDRATVESLGYHVDKDGTISQQQPDETGKPIWKPFSKLGARRTVLNDLAPAATFIAFNQNTPVDTDMIAATSRALLAESTEAVGHLYHLDTKSASGGMIDHMTWSEVLICGSCSKEFDFWSAGVDKKTKAILDELVCPFCKSEQRKRDLTRAQEKLFDPHTNVTVQVAKYIPVAVEMLSDRIERDVTRPEARASHELEEMHVASWFPSATIDRDIDLWYERDYRSLGLLSVDRFYTRRNLAVLADLWHRALEVQNVRIKNGILFSLTAMLVNLSRMNRWRPDVSFPYNPLSGTLYIPSLSVESNALIGVANKVKRLIKIWDATPLAGEQLITTQSATSLAQVPSNSVDYVFIDPPFGSNIIYSDLSILYEAWLRIDTNTRQEAVIHRRKKKDPMTLEGYRALITDSLREVHRCLKPGRWVTIEFSNTRASVWNAIHTALQDAGLVVANVAALDKQMGSFKAVTTPTAVKQDLVISAYKPNGGFEERFKKEAASDEGVWDFVRTHLKYLPIIKRGTKAVQLVTVTERDPRILFDRMVSYYVRSGFAVPVNSGEFQQGLAERFAYRDGMYFLPEQAAEYDKHRMLAEEVADQLLFVSDESSAIQWLRQMLKEKPQIFSDLNAKFMQQIGGWSKHEQQLDLRELLTQNFLCYDGIEPVPEQIHAYLSSNWKELRNQPKTDPKLREKANDRWYVPDPNKAGDLEKLREKSLIKEFEVYRATKQRTLKVFRTEAVRVGFKSAYDRQDYKTIVEVATKLPENVLQEDEKLLMYYDVATMRLGDEDKGKLFK